LLLNPRITSAVPRASCASQTFGLPLDVDLRLERKTVQARSTPSRLRSRVLECIDEHGHSESVGPEDELLSPVVRDVTRLGEDADTGLPLFLRQLDFGCERV
jgi:hypothetical protein